MTAFNQNFSASVSSTGQLSMVRWYYGSFKEISIGVLRAVSRAIKMITRNRNLI